MTTGYIVQHNGTTQFTADGLNINGQLWNFTDSTPPPPPPGRLTNALVTWLTHASFTQPTDVTQYKNVAGVIQAHQEPIDWPYVSGATWKFAVPVNNYVALAINVPPVGMPVTNHSIKNPNEVAGVSAWDVSMSTSPGDFNGPTVLTFPDGHKAYWENVRQSDTPVFYFRNGAGTNFYLGLNPGATVFMNFRIHGGLAGTMAVASQ